MAKEVFLYHNSQEKALIAEAKRLKLKDKVLAAIQFACLLGAIVASLTLLCSAYYDMVKVCASLI